MTLRHAWLLGATLALASPAVHADGSEEVAIVASILRSGEAVKGSGEAVKERLPRSEFAIFRDGQGLQGSTGSALYAGDEISTGERVSVVVEFLEAVGREYAEVTVAPSSRVKISGTNSVEGVLGRFLATLDGFFEIGLRDLEAVLGVRGTELEVTVSGTGTAEVRVLEGQVSVAGAELAAPSAARARGEVAALPVSTVSGAGAHLGLTVREGELAKAAGVLKLTNPCERKHRFALALDPASGWVDVESEAGVVVLEGRSTTFVEYVMLADATKVPSARYEGRVLARCLDCTEQGCAPPTEGTRLIVDVLGVPRIGPLERASFGWGSQLAPETMAEQEVLSVLEWTSEVAIRTQPSYAAPDAPPNFVGTAERAAAFREARVEAILGGAPDAHERLGDVYSDWGRGKRALHAYSKALPSNPAGNAALLTKRAEANRRVGRLDTAQQLLEGALSINPEDGHLYNSLGNVYFDRASLANADGRGLEGEPADAWLARSLEAFDTATRLVASVDSGERTRRAIGVTFTNASRVRLAQAEASYRRGDQETAHDLRLQGLRRLDYASDRYPEYPFAILTRGRFAQQRGRFVNDGQGQRERELSFNEAEALYSDAVRVHPDLAAGYYDLGTLWEARGDADRATQQYLRAVREEPAFAPAYGKLANLLAAQDPALAARYDRVHQKLERDDFRRDDGEEDEEARRPREEVEQVKVPRISRLGGGTVTADRFAERLRENNLVPGAIREVASCEDPGRVVSSDPPRNGKIAVGTVVSILVAGPGADARRVPDLTGMQQRQGGQALARAGLAIGKVREEASDNPEGTVTDQSPAPQTMLAPGCEVDITVATRVKVPRLKGRTKRQALRTLGRSSSGLEVGEVTEKVSDAVADGHVLSQEPAEGALVPWGTSVDLVLARCTRVPLLKGLGKAAALAALQEAGLIGDVVIDRGNRVTVQEPEEGECAGLNRKVTLQLGPIVQ